MRRVLRPLVRLLISQQVAFPDVANLLRSLYVEVAEKDFQLPKKPTTDSRVSLLTGIYRRDVKRLRAELQESETGSAAPASSASIGGLIVSRWLADPAFLDAEGHPQELERREGRHGQPSFSQLVRSVSVDVRPQSVLDEWLRLGVVAVTVEGRVRLEREAFVPTEGFQEMAHYFGRNLRDHVAAAAHNLAGEEPPFLERSVFYAQLTPQAVAELRKLSAEVGAEAIGRVNREALRLQQSSRNDDSARHRMTFGAYFYRELKAGSGRPERPEDQAADEVRSDDDEGGNQ